MTSIIFFSMATTDNETTLWHHKPQGANRNEETQKVHPFIDKGPELSYRMERLSKNRAKGKRRRAVFGCLVLSFLPDVSVASVSPSPRNLLPDIPASDAASSKAQDNLEKFSKDVENVLHVLKGSEYDDDPKIPGKAFVIQSLILHSKPHTYRLILTSAIFRLHRCLP